MNEMNPAEGHIKFLQDIDQFKKKMEKSKKSIFIQK